MSNPGQMLLDAVAKLHQETVGKPEGSMTVKEIEEKLDISYSAALKYINQLLADGKVYKIRRGNNQHYYILKEKEGKK